MPASIAPGPGAVNPKGFHLRYAVLAAAFQACLQSLVWGFSVDDAWIVSRVAHHGATSGQFHFNLGTYTDAVTPFGFAHAVGKLGAWMGATEKFDLFRIARVSGVVAQVGSFFMAGGLIPRRVPVGGLLWLSLGCLPSALWAGAGLATPWVGLFLVLGVFCLPRVELLGALLAGGAAAWRPELTIVVLAVVSLQSQVALQFQTAVSRRHVAARYLLVGGLTLLPLLITSCARRLFFGAWVPLSAIAKAPDLQSGLHYGAVSLIWGGLLLHGLWAPAAYRRSGSGWIVLALVVSIVACGGDWMPGMRLCAPVYPLLIAVVGQGPWELNAARKRRAQLGRWLALAWVPVMPVWLLIAQGEDFRAVVERRTRLVQLARPVLADAAVIAAIDVGWVGMATDAQIVDLAGVTDPRIGALSGGHTHRPLSTGLFSDRNVDQWVIRAVDRNYRVGERTSTIVPVYGTDYRLLRSSADLGLEGSAVIPLEGTRGQYVVVSINRSVDDRN